MIAIGSLADNVTAEGTATFVVEPGRVQVTEIVKSLSWSPRGTTLSIDKNARGLSAQIANWEKLPEFVALSFGELVVNGNVYTGFADPMPAAIAVVEDRVAELVNDARDLEMQSVRRELAIPWRVARVDVTGGRRRPWDGEFHPTAARRTAGSAVGDVLHRAHRIKAVACSCGAGRDRKARRRDRKCSRSFDPYCPLTGSKI